MVLSHQDLISLIDNTLRSSLLHICIIHHLQSLRHAGDLRMLSSILFEQRFHGVKSIAMPLKMMVFETSF